MKLIKKYKTIESIIENCKYEVPENYLELVKESRRIFLMWKDKINVDEINIHRSQKNMAGLIQFLVNDIEMNSTKVQNGIKKTMNRFNN